MALGDLGYEGLGRSRATRTALVVVAAALAACGDTTGPEGQPPQLPDVESLTMDIDHFTQGGTPAQLAPQAVAGLNWAAAALSVGVANLAVVVHLAVPVATWKAATAQAPVLEDGVWHWRFSATEGGHTYAGDLAGYRDGDDRVFEMTIGSSALGLEEFLWYRGRAPIGGTTGRWEFYDPSAPSTVSGSIEWSHPENDVWILTFAAESGVDAGDELTYRTDAAERTVTFHDASADETVEVHWSGLTYEGWIVAPGYNGGVKACWDGTLANTPCG